MHLLSNATNILKVMKIYYGQLSDQNSSQLFKVLTWGMKVTVTYVFPCSFFIALASNNQA